jgi:hypothetical protein
MMFGNFLYGDDDACPLGSWGNFKYAVLCEPIVSFLDRPSK